MIFQKLRYAPCVRRDARQPPGQSPFGESPWVGQVWAIARESSLKPSSSKPAYPLFEIVTLSKNCNKSKKEGHRKGFLPPSTARKTHLMVVEHFESFRRETSGRTALLVDFKRLAMSNKDAVCAAPNCPFKTPSALMRHNRIEDCAASKLRRVRVPRCTVVVLLDCIHLNIFSTRLSQAHHSSSLVPVGDGDVVSSKW